MCHTARAKALKSCGIHDLRVFTTSSKVDRNIVIRYVFDRRKEGRGAKSPFPVFKWNFSVADVCRHKGRGGVVIEEGRGPNLCNP